MLFVVLSFGSAARANFTPASSNAAHAILRQSQPSLKSMRCSFEPPPALGCCSARIGRPPIFHSVVALTLTLLRRILVLRWRSRRSTSLYGRRRGAVCRRRYPVSRAMPRLASAPLETVTSWPKSARASCGCNLLSVHSSSMSTRGGVVCGMSCFLRLTEELDGAPSPLHACSAARAACLPIAVSWILCIRESLRLGKISHFVAF